MNIGFGGFMRLIFQLNSKLHFTLLMAITLYSLLLLTTYLRHLSFSLHFFFPYKNTQQDKTKPNSHVHKHKHKTQPQKSQIERERKKEESPEVRTFSEKIPCCFFHLKHLQISTQVPNSTTHYTTLFYIFNPTLIINK